MSAVEIDTSDAFGVPQPPSQKKIDDTFVRTAKVSSELNNGAIRPIVTRNAPGGKVATPEVPKAVRHQKAANGLKGFPVRSMRKLARRGGVKRISRRALEAAMNYGKDFTKKAVELALAYVDSAKRQTCSTKDVLEAFRMMGCSLYGAESMP